MRLERSGGPPDLQMAFKILIQRHMCGRALDENHAKEGAEGQFPDFACFGDRVLIEMKHLETDQKDRVNKIFETKIQPAERPMFFGEIAAHHIIDSVSNGQAIKQEIASRLGKTIEQLLSKANAQFQSYRSRHPRKNSVNICVILNSRVQEFSPAVVVHAIHGKIKTARPDEPRFPHIDAILYFSEKHFRILPDGRAGCAVSIFELVGAENHPWKKQFIERIVDAWSRMRTGSSVVEAADPYGFEVIQDIPDSLRRYEAWMLEYQRNPYLSALSLERLRVSFQRAVAVNSLAFVKGSWPKPSKEKIAEGLRVFQHVVEETKRRGIDLRMLDPRLLSSKEREEVYAGLPLELARLLTGNDPSSKTKK
jgi:hypothetical protein